MLAPDPRHCHRNKPYPASRASQPSWPFITVSHVYSGGIRRGTSKLEICLRFTSSLAKKRRQTRKNQRSSVRSLSLSLSLSPSLPSRSRLDRGRFAHVDRVDRQRGTVRVALDGRVEEGRKEGEGEGAKERRTDGLRAIGALRSVTRHRIRPGLSEICQPATMRAGRILARDFILRTLKSDRSGQASGDEGGAEGSAGSPESSSSVCEGEEEEEEVPRHPYLTPFSPIK